MLRQRCHIPSADWDVEIFYDAHPKDADSILDVLWDMGCAREHLYKAEGLLKSGVTNEGLTFSNPRDRYSLVVIGHTDDALQFMNSLSHEKYAHDPELLEAYECGKNEGWREAMREAEREERYHERRTWPPMYREPEWDDDYSERRRRRDSRGRYI